MTEAPPPRRRKLSRWISWPIGTLLILAGLLALAVVAIDSGPGHRLIANRIAAWEDKSGLRIRIGRIDGSIFGRAIIRDLKVYDAEALLFDTPAARLDWRPIAWLNNRLQINRLTAELGTFHKVPKFKPGDGKPFKLPGFDIAVGRLTIERLRFAPAITGKQRIGRLDGRADIADGRAMVMLAANVESGGDRLRTTIDVAPERNRFDIDVRIAAPQDGVLAAMLTGKRAVTAVIDGQGTWTAWRGIARADVAGQRTIDLTLAADSGQYRLSGTLAPAPFLKGRLQRLTAPRVAVDGRASFIKRRLDGVVTLRSPALLVRGTGIVDLGQSVFDNLRIDARLLQPAAMVPNMRGRDITLRLLFDGAFDTARFDYLLTAPQVFFDNTGFEQVRVAGRGRLSDAPVRVPVDLSARRVVGVGDVAGGILANLSVRGTLLLTAKTLIGDALALRSDKLNGRINLFVDLATGRYAIGLNGKLQRYLIPGIGIVDVESELKAVPGPSGRGTRIEGRGRAWVRRFDNAFFASLAGGLPMIDTGLIRDADGVLRFINLKLRAPKIAIDGTGLRRRDGSFYFKGSGRQAQYGPLQLTLDGRIERPKIDLLLARPLDALGLDQVRVMLDPSAAGFSYRAAGGSTLGPFTSTGEIRLPKGADAVIAVAALDVAGTRGTGTLTTVADGFRGGLDVAGGGISGQIGFDVPAAIQRIRIDLTARDANFAGPPAIGARRGTVMATVLLDPAGIDIDASTRGRGLRYGNVRLARFAGAARLVDGVGRVTGQIAGSRGRAFDLAFAADVGRDGYRISGEGTVDRRPLKLETPAAITRDGDLWELAPTRLAFAGGSADLSGRLGNGETAIEARVQRMPLSILDIAYPDLALGGFANGTLSFNQQGSAPPTGKANLVVRGLTRAGLVLSSRPVDAGITGVLTAASAAVRAIVISDGKTIGRAQARLTPLGDSGSLSERLTNAPLFAQLRYNGSADILWRLTGVETFDLSGPVAIGADVGGRLNDPVINGSVRTSGARLESAVTGMVITNINATGRFAGSQLTLDNFSGTAGKGGTVSGSGVFNLAAARGFGIDLDIKAENAVLIDRDDFGATVTGPLKIRSDGDGGLISGDVDLVTSRYQLGRATAGEAVPKLKVRELNRNGEFDEPESAPSPWRLALKAQARNRVTVTGLGLESEWRADLTIGGSATAPVFGGTATLLRGDYDFAGRRFELDRGEIRFNGSDPPNPLLDIDAEAQVEGVSATINVGGTALKPEIRFSSVPALPQDELLSRLLFGSSITDISAPEAVQLAAAIAALQGGGGGLDPINAVRKATGLDRLRVLPADVATGAGTSVAAGKYLGRRTYVEVITDGQGYSATRVEFQVFRWLSVLSTISTIGRQSVNVRISKDY